MSSPTRVLACATLLMLCACKPAQPPAPPENAAPQSAAPAGAKPAGKTAPVDADYPALQVATLDGASFDLAQHRGKWVVVNFWATWCKPCVKEMPDLSALDTMRDHVQVVGLAYDDSDPEDIRAFLAKHPVSYPVAIVSTFEPMESFATPRGLPTTYLIGPDGKMTKKFLGPVTAKDIESAIATAGGPKAG